MCTRKWLVTRISERDSRSSEENIKFPDVVTWVVLGVPNGPKKTIITVCMIITDIAFCGFSELNGTLNL